MIEKIGPIKNPLTIIAIFAAIAEISGTVVLPFIAPANQATYIWFLIVFPMLLIILFFLTLNFNHKVLYAPSDYQNEDNFLQSLPRATFAEKALKIEAEIAEEAKIVDAPRTEQPPIVSEVQPDPATANSEDPIRELIRRSPQAEYVFAEEAIFKRLANEFGSKIQREVRVDGPDGKYYIFDGIVRDKGITTAVEVKMVRNSLLSTMLIKQTLERIKQAAQVEPLEHSGSFRVLLALAISGKYQNPEEVLSYINRMRDAYPFPIEVRFYPLHDLEQDSSIAA